MYYMHIIVHLQRKLYKIIKKEILLDIYGFIQLEYNNAFNLTFICLVWLNKYDHSVSVFNLLCQNIVNVLYIYDIILFNIVC